MEDLSMTLSYAEWVIIVGVTIGLFNYFSKKYVKLVPLAAIVLLLTWIIVAIVRGIKYIYLGISNDLSSINGLLMLLAEVLPMFILFAGITFTLKFIRFKKRGEQTGKI